MSPTAIFASLAQGEDRKIRDSTIGEAELRQRDKEDPDVREE